MLWRKIKQGKGIGIEMEAAVLNKRIKESHIKKVTFEEKLGDDGVSHVDFWGKHFPGRGNNCNDLEVKATLAY